MTRLSMSETAVYGRLAHRWRMTGSHQRPSSLEIDRSAALAGDDQERHRRALDSHENWQCEVAVDRVELDAEHTVGQAVDRALIATSPPASIDVM